MYITNFYLWEMLKHNREFFNKQHRYHMFTFINLMLFTFSFQIILKDY